MTDETSSTQSALPTGKKKPRERRKSKSVSHAGGKRTAARTLSSALSRRVHASSACVYEACLISSLERVAEPGLGTFAVAFVGARPVLFYDPAVLAEMSERELDVTLMHEVMHLTHHHPARGKMLDTRFGYAAADQRERRLQFRAHMVASDYAINEVLRLHVKEMGYASAPLGYWAFPSERKLPSMLTYEQYFALVLAQLREEQDKRDEKGAANADGASKGEAGRGAGGNGSGSPGGGGRGAGTTLVLVGVDMGEPDADAEKRDASGGGDGDAKDGDAKDEASAPPAALKLARPQNKEDMLEVADAILILVAKHETEEKERSDKLAQVYKDFLCAPPPALSMNDMATVVDAMLNAAKQQVQGYGKSLPGVYGKTEVVLSEAPLEGLDGLFEALRQVTATHLGGGYGLSMRTISRAAAARVRHCVAQASHGAAFALRMPLVPGVGYSASLCIAIVLDTSGSMYQSLLSYGISAVRDVIEELGIQEGVMLECDDRTTNVLRLEPGVELPAHVVGRGGTSFDPGLLGAVQWAADNGVELDAIVYITDGVAPTPVVTVDVPVIWAGVGDAVPVLPGVPGNINVVLGRDASL